MVSVIAHQKEGKMEKNNNTPVQPNSLIEKYNIPSPRYTSYPPVPVWKGIEQKTWFQLLNQSLEKDSSLSLYIHVPFCKELCSFCGCTKVITKDKSKGREYLDLIKKEYALAAQKIHSKPTLKEMHLGGGSPSWLPADELDELLSFFLDSEKFQMNRDQLELSIELDPRTTTYEQVQILKKHGFNRASLGVQDTHEEVLDVIRRRQSFEQVKNVFDWLKNADIKLINIDLIYGLPKQTEQTIIETLENVRTLGPTRIAFYSYAHIPSMRPAQKIVERHGLPDAELKRKLYEVGKAFLLGHGYLEIGMDHFATAEDKLYHAYKTGNLHRNFMGYTVQYSKNLLGFGPSSLSSIDEAFAQNEKEYKDWKSLIQDDHSPIIHGHVLSNEEQNKRKMIMDLMCHFKTEAKIKNLPEWQQKNLAALSTDHLIEIHENVLIATEMGKTFIRNICMAIDDTYRPQNRHSSSI